MYHPYQQEQPIVLNQQEQTTKDIYYPDEKQKRKQSLEKNRLAGNKLLQKNIPLFTKSYVSLSV
jgi:hypothetical protein